jgi:hypothetical protein
MTNPVLFAGGCLCGAVRYEATAEPAYAGLCYCADCRKASGSGFIPFMGFKAECLSIRGEVRQSHVPSFSGGTATRNHCAHCGSLVFGGIHGESDEHTIYAGSLDDSSQFKPGVALFVRDRPAWAEVRADLQEFETMPGV